MTEEIRSSLEVIVEHRCYKTIVRAESWTEVLSLAQVAKMKMRIAELTCCETQYDFTTDRWHIVISETLEPIRNRIALALFLVFPERITRDELANQSSIKAGSLRQYLTKPELEVQPHIDENQEGIRLNGLGYKWACEILDSIESQSVSLEEKGVDERTDE